MNVITEALRNFRRAPLVDLDTPHEPSAAPVLFPCAGSSADQSPRSGRPGVDGPAASAEQVGAVGHPDWTSFRANIDEVLNGLAFAGRSLVDIAETVDQLARWVDRYDPPAEPTPITDLDRKRKGRPSPP